jgi:DNA-binding transcriptional MerR regulator
LNATETRYLSTADAAARAGVSTATIRNWINAGILLAHQAVENGVVRIDPRDLDAALRPK